MPQSVTRRPRRAKPRWQRRKEARPEEIVAAALEQFVERGFAATRLEDVARRAGVTKGTLYLYFKNKEALFKAVVRETIVPVIAQGESIAASFTGSARELLERLVREYWRLVYDTALAGIPKLMMAEAGNFPQLARFYYEEVVTRGHRLLGGVIERGHQERRVPPGGRARRRQARPVPVDARHRRAARLRALHAGGLRRPEIPRHSHRPVSPWHRQCVDPSRSPSRRSALRSLRRPRSRPPHRCASPSPTRSRGRPAPRRP